MKEQDRHNWVHEGGNSSFNNLRCADCHTRWKREWGEPPMVGITVHGWASKPPRPENCESVVTLPTKEALEVFAKAKENHTGDMPFDGRLIPNQWLLNERGLNEQLGNRIEELETAIRTVVEDGPPLRPADRMDTCAHDKYGWENCEVCITDYLESVLKQEQE